MLLANYLPRLTIAEAERCWMQPIDLCELAIIGEEHRPETRKFLANISDRGLVDFVKSGEAKTSPKLYSLKSAIMLHAFRALTDLYLPYDVADPIAMKVYDVAKELIGTVGHYHDISELDWIVLFHVERGKPVGIKVLREDEVTADRITHSYHSAGGHIEAGRICFNILRRYGDYWSQDRIKHRVDAPAGRYDGVDLDGNPLDPAHPLNKNLPPLEYAKRLLEIEQYIAARDVAAAAQPEGEPDTS